MARHNELGRKGEALAADWLAGKGYEILHRNWRHGRYEVDIIAIRDGVHHFIEVKTGSEGDYGYPEERVSRQKIRNMMQGASAWLSQLPGVRRVQYDVLSITIRKNADPEFFLIEDVYA